MRIKKVRSLRGNVALPGDKSISHRAIILASLCQGKVAIKNLLDCDDTRATLGVFRELGVDYKFKKDSLVVEGRGQYGLRKTRRTLDCGESGTTIRLLAGLLAAQKFASVLSGSPSLCRRPMARIIKPLKMMGADIKGRRSRSNEEFAPLTINPVQRLKPIRYALPVSSAQVKSCLMLAALYAEGKTVITEKEKSRDHTERLLKFCGAKITVKGKRITLTKSSLKNPGEIIIPSDFSSAAFFIATALIVKKSNLTIKNVSLNPTRTGFISVLKRMGADFELKLKKNSPEPYGDIRVKTSPLKSTTIEKREIPLIIDELPVFMVLATQATGTSVIKNCQELKVKETDRIQSMVYNLKTMGASINVRRKNGDYYIYIRGKTPLKGSHKLKSFGDHRTALSIFVASQATGNSCSMDNFSCVSKSLPGFLEIISNF